MLLFHCRLYTAPSRTTPHVSTADPACHGWLLSEPRGFFWEEHFMKLMWCVAFCLISIQSYMDDVKGNVHMNATTKFEVKEEWNCTLEVSCLHVRSCDSFCRLQGIITAQWQTDRQWFFMSVAAERKTLTSCCVPACNSPVLFQAPECLTLLTPKVPTLWAH